MSAGLSDRLHQEHYAAIMDWLAKPAPRTPPAIFLYGPPGVGKTTLAHRALQDAGLRVAECNASQFRHKAAMSELIEPLLHSNNVSDFFRPEGHRALGIVLDEIDGMSTGDKGGLTELVRILADYKGPNAIICISNEWAEKRYKPLIRLALCRHVTPPDLTSCATWLGVPPSDLEPLWTRHQGDLRKLLQAQGATDESDTTNDITRSMTVQDLVMGLLAGELDIQEDVHLDNNYLNLAGLHLHETLPDWIRDHHGSGPDAWAIYSDCLRSISTSDRQDYYTFFHQHWSLFPLSFQSKLQAVNHRLFSAPLPREGKSWKFQYTSVLSRESWLINQFKYLCELRDALEQSPMRDGGLELALWTASALAKTGGDGTHLFTAKPPLKERVQRWLQKLAVPTVPPCPIGKTAPTPKTPGKRSAPVTPA
jgi:hypothetical protein